ncbi:MAG: hypothetical protein WAU86_21300 [Oricola sp.]
MFSMLNRYGLPAKYAVIGTMLGIFAAALAVALGFDDPASAAVRYPVTGCVCGLMLGLIRKSLGAAP